MGTHYSHRHVVRPHFSWDAQNSKTYVTDSTANDILGKTTIPVTGVTVSAAPSGKTGKTYTFNNGVNSFYASDYIRPVVTTSDEWGLNTTRGISSFVTFKNTSLLDAAALSYYRQTPFSYGNDGQLGSWNFERHYLSSNFLFRYHFDQEPIYGTTINIGTVDLNVVTQLGFTQSASELVVYKNGVPYSTLDVSAKTLTTPPTLIAGIGAQRGEIYGFIGEIYNATFWQSPISPTEVLNHYNDTINRFEI